MDRFTAIQIFARVAETGSFSKAARDLNVGQPSVTRNVAAMEHQLGARLLNRNTRGVSLTEIGTQYYEKCKIILRELDEANNLIGARHRGLDGVLRISTSVAFGRRIVAPLVMEFIAQNPGLRVDLSCEDAYVDLIAQGVDLAVRVGRLADSSLGGRFIGMNPWVMVASPSYLSRSGTPETPDALTDHSCLVYSSVQGDDAWHLRSPSGERCSVSVKGRLRSNNLSTILAAANAHFGVAILPHYVAAASLRAGTIVQIMERYTLNEQEIHIVFPSPRLVPSKVLAFIAHFKARLDGPWWLQSP